MLRAGVAFRFIKDHLGSVRFVVNATTGVVAQALEYDEFGNVTRDTLPGFQPFGFAGGLYDADTGLVRFGARDYDATIGRWVAKDPIGFGGGHNFYAYCDSDPINQSDPTGHKKYSREEVNEILLDYRIQIDTSTRQELFAILWSRHKGCGSSDYWCHEREEAPGEEDTPDTFDVNGRTMNAAQFGNYIAGYGAGYWSDPQIYAILRAAGSAFGVLGVLQGYSKFTWDQIVFVGDNADSVMHIDMGNADGLLARARRVKRTLRGKR